MYQSREMEEQICQQQQPQSPQIITDKCIEEAIPAKLGKKYSYVEKIGNGSYGTVVKAFDHHKNRYVACKLIPRHSLNSYYVLQAFEQELRVISTLHHPNIVEVYDIIYDVDMIIIVMELYEAGDLLTYISTNIGQMNMNVLKKIFFQVVSAVEFIHSKGIAHCDIKLENILLDFDMNAKLADFGCCKTEQVNKAAMLAQRQQRYPSRMGIMCGTLYYMAPETLSRYFNDGEKDDLSEAKTLNFYKKADIWSLGILLYLFAYGRFPWIITAANESNDNEIVDQIKKCRFITHPIKLSPMISDLIDACLRTNPDKRPTASDILNMPWFTNEKRIRHSTQKLNNGKLIHGLSAPGKILYGAQSLIVRPIVKSVSGI